MANNLKAFLVHLVLFVIHFIFLSFSISLISTTVFISLCFIIMFTTNMNHICKYCSHIAYTPVPGICVFMPTICGVSSFSRPVDIYCCFAQRGAPHRLNVTITTATKYTCYEYTNRGFVLLLLLLRPLNERFELYQSR